MKLIIELPNDFSEIFKVLSTFFYRRFAFVHKSKCLHGKIKKMHYVENKFDKNNQWPLSAGWKT